MNSSKFVRSYVDRPAIYAHRGSSIVMPENTLPAYEWSLAQGSDVLETDVRLSSDGTLYMFHDEDLSRITETSGLVLDASDDDLNALDAAYHFTDGKGQSLRGSGVKLITLEELFTHFPDVPINIDIKDNIEQAAAETARLIKAYDRFDLTTVGSFHTNVIAHLRKIAPRIRTAALKGEVANLYFGRCLPRKVSNCCFCALQIPQTYMRLPLATRAFVEYGKSLGIEIVFWTVNDVADMKRLWDLGVDGIVTDYPDRAYALFNDSEGKTESDQSD